VEIVSHHSPLGSFYVPPEFDIAWVPTNAEWWVQISSLFVVQKAKSIQQHPKATIVTYPISIGKTYFGF